MPPSKSPLNWTNIIFFSTTPIIAVVGVVLLCVFGIVHWPTWILAGGYLLGVGLTITAGYHRLFAHKSYRAAWPLRLILVLFGSAAFEGSVLEWCTDHRTHHRYTDTDKDPYNIKQGFWHAHMGWLFRLNPKTRDFSNVEDLQQDRLLRLQHKYYPIIAIFMGFVFPAVIAALWGDPLGGLIIAGVLRMTINQHCTFAVNSVCHYFGEHTYSDRLSARDNWLTAFITCGEGFHNFHHQFPIDYRNGVRAFHFDPSKWLIKLCSWIGLARELKRVSKSRILRYRLGLVCEPVLNQRQLPPKQQ